jgi:hypothetical protein
LIREKWEGALEREMDAATLEKEMGAWCSTTTFSSDDISCPEADEMLEV